MWTAPTHQRSTARGLRVICVPLERILMVDPPSALCARQAPTLKQQGLHGAAGARFFRSMSFLRVLLD